MPSIGETLREARMRQRLDIADVEERTKIRAKYLRALENEEFGLLPGPTFARTFLRTYAEVLGLDPHVLVEEYRTNYERQEELLDVQAIGASPPPQRERERRYTGGPPSRMTVVVGAVVLLLAFLLALGLTDGEDEGERTAQTAGDTETAKKPAKRERRRAKPLPASVTVQITPTAPTFICADNGPGTALVFPGQVTTEEQTFKGKKVRVRLGNRAFEMEVNGKPFAVEPGPNAVTYEFSVTGSKRLPEGVSPCPA